MELNAWTSRLHSLYQKALTHCRSGQHDPASCFDAEETAFLASIGLRPIHVCDYAEDFVSGGEPDWDTYLLIASARRDYFLYVQKRAANPAVTQASELPPKDAELGGIRWLPRLIRKATCFLEGGLCHEIMYCCGGDRNFFKKHGIHPADFLREIWASKGNEEKILAFVQTAGSRPA